MKDFHRMLSSLWHTFKKKWSFVKRVKIGCLQLVVKNADGVVTNQLPLIDGRYCCHVGKFEYLTLIAWPGTSCFNDINKVLRKRHHFCDWDTLKFACCCIVCVWYIYLWFSELLPKLMLRPFYSYETQHLQASFELKYIYSFSI